MTRFIVVISTFLITFSAQAREPISDKKIKQIVSEFQYESTYEIIELKNLGNNSKSKKCHKYTFNIKTNYPSSEDIYVTGKLYVPNPKYTDGEIPFVIQLPPMGGTNILDRWMGGTLCKSKMAGFIIGNDFTGFDDKNAPPVEDHDDAQRRTIAALKASLAFARDDIRFNEEKVGLLGVSLGGILGSMAMGALKEVSASYFIVAGGDLPHIIAWSKQKRVKRLRRLRMKEQGFESQEVYEAWLRDHLTLDPYDLARKVPPETIYMVISSNDKSVPSSDQFLLREGFNEPNHHVRTSGHTGTVINTLLWGSNRRKIINWYKERFLLENPRKEFPGKQEPFGYAQSF